ncbi:MAG: SpoIIE family protein phosphatase [Acidobacteria bacterium]|nr:SpoIIE family protein phosphatase [Acidobacteriota bacterium]
MLRLLVTPAQGDSFELPLEGEELIVGRSSDCDLPIRDRFMSRRHARLFRQAEGWFIEDLGSRNGTLLDGSPVDAPKPISAGSEISLSSSLLRIEETNKPRSWPNSRQSNDQTIFRSASELLESQDTISPDDSASAEVLASHAGRLQILNELHQVLARSLTLDDLMNTFLERAFDLLQPEEAVIILRQPDGEYTRAARKAAPGYEEERLLSKTLVHQVAEQGQAALVLDVAEDQRFAEAESIVASGVRSLIAAPLADADGSIGMIALNSRLHRHQFSEADMELLTSLGAVAALRLRNLALAKEAAELHRVEHEVRLAREIQIGLLPDRLPDLPGYEIYGGSAPSQGVSGDFYEAVERTADDTCAILVADVSGKGISAALLTASLEALLAGPLEAGDYPDSICLNVSRRLLARTPAAKYATALLAVLTPASGRLVYTNAGHNPGLLVRSAGAVVRLDACGPPLGLLPEPDYTRRETKLEPGDLLVLYTDGITEAEGPDEEEFGVERLSSLCAELRRAPLPEVAEAVSSALDEFVRGVPFADDRTLVLLRRQAKEN